jgi:hypothetical protein
MHRSQQFPDVSITRTFLNYLCRNGSELRATTMLGRSLHRPSESPSLVHAVCRRR